MRFVVLGLLFVGLTAGGCAGRRMPVSAATTPKAVTVSGVWDGVVHQIVSEGMSAGDSRIEKQEWHLSQSGPSISGYYLAASTYTSGDGRPYVCSRQTSFSALVRFEVSGRVSGEQIDLDEVKQRASEGNCTAGQRPLAHYHAEVQGDVLTLVTDGQRQLLYRNRGAAQAAEPNTASELARTPPVTETALHASRQRPPTAERLSSQLPVDVSGVWIWEHRGPAPTGDEKHEREEWHVDQDGDHLSGYYDRVVHEISTDGHAFKCSMDLEFEIATRYRFRGQVSGNQIVIYESSYEVLEPSACDNGQRRLDAYEGQSNGDEVKLIWGVGGQILRRPRPDVPTQRF
jgi:hypothetical protein